MKTIDTENSNIEHAFNHKKRTPLNTRRLHVSWLLSISLASIVLPLSVQGQSAPAAARITPQNPPTQVDQAEKQTQHRLTMWNWSLAQITKREHINLFMDVPLPSEPPIARYNGAYGVAAMKALARATQRTWKQIDGVQAFARTEVVKGSQEITATLAYLNSLSPEQFDKLLAGTTTLDQLDGQSRELIQRLSGWEPDMNFALLGKTEAAQLKLSVSPKVQYHDPHTGEMKSLNLLYRPERTPLKHSVKRAEPIVPLDIPEHGKLDFGKGATLTLQEIADKAEQAFDVAYVVDERVAKNYYFVSGRYSQAAFEHTLEYATTVPPVHSNTYIRPDRRRDLALLQARMKAGPKQKLDVTGLRDSIPKRGSDDIDRLNQQYGPKEELEASDFLDGKSVRCGDLCQGKPGLSAFFESNGLAPDTMLTLSADFMLAIQSEGEHEAASGYAEADGQPNPTLVTNETLIGLE